MGRLRGRCRGGGAGHAARGVDLVEEGLSGRAGGAEGALLAGAEGPRGWEPFGGADLGTLFVTTEDGHLFQIRDTGRKGHKR